MENKLLTYILQMQKQSSTQSVPKLPKAQKGKTVFSFKNDNMYPTISNDNIPSNTQVRNKFIRDEQGRAEIANRKRIANIPTVRSYNPEKEDESLLSRLYHIAVNPMTALSYKTHGKDIPDHFERGEKNILETATNVINPFSYVDAGSRIPGNLARGEFAEAGFNALTVFPAAAEFRSLAPLVKKGSKIIKNAYNTVATGESALPIAWKSPAVGLTQEASADMFKGIANADKLSDADRALLLEYQYDSKPFTGRTYGDGVPNIDQAKRQALNNVIKNNEVTFNNNAILTRKFNPDNKSLGAEFSNGRLNLGDRPTSFSAGVGNSGYGSGSVNRIVLPNRYAKQMGDKFLANEYGIPSDKTFDLLSGETKNFAAARGVMPEDLINVERELIGTGLDLKRIGKVKNDIGGYDYIVKPRSISKPTGTQEVTRGPINYWEEPGFASRNPNFNPQAYASTTAQKFNVEDLPDNLMPFMERNLTKDKWKAFNSEQRRLSTNYKLGYDKYDNGGMIVDPMGQWAHPGQVTRIPSANITMQGVPYPVLGVASNGQQVMMQPGQDYNFGNAEHVDEYPMMQNGGFFDKYSESMRQDATRNVIPRKMTDRERLEASAYSDQAQKRALTNTKEVIAERKKNISTKGDLNTPGSWNIKEKARLFPNSVGRAGEMFDEYVNPATYVGIFGDALGESVAARDPKGVALSLAMATGAGAMGLDPLGGGIKAVKSLTKQLPNAAKYTLGSMYKTYNENIYPILNKEKLVPYADKITKLNEMNAATRESLKSGELRKRLINQGLTEEEVSNMKVPNLAFFADNKSPGTSYSRYQDPNNSLKLEGININFDQLNRLKNNGISLEAAYEHEVGHFLQRPLANKNPLNDLNKYNELLKNYKKDVRIYKKEGEKLANDYGLDKNKVIKDDDKERYRLYLRAMREKDEAAVNWFDRKPQLPERPNYESELDKKVRDLNFNSENSFSNYFNKDHEAYPFLREMRQTMVDQGFIKDKYQDMNKDVISNFLNSKTKNRLKEILSRKEKESNTDILHTLFKNLPAVAPAVIASQSQEMPEMGRGGYTVTRSSDRKGKTHKVTGPGGVVKYFGDSKLGQHPKDPERKKAFYARHKSNLAGNPFFRAFARKTWEEGGQTDDDREMLSGVADMLRRVNDVNNRKQIANYMMDNFRDEDVTFEPDKFLRSANAFGNNIPKAQTGREVKKKFVMPQSSIDFNNRLTAQDEATKKVNLDAMRQYYINSGQPYFTENKSPREKAEPWTDPVLDRIDRENNEKYEDRDGGFENFLEFIDPTGISSWDDVGRTFKNPSASNMEKGFALFSALPYVGKLGKLAKGTKALNTAVKANALQKLGRGALKGVDIVTGGPAMRYFDQTLNPLSRGFGTLTEKAVGQIPYSGVRKAFEIGSDFNQMRRFQDGLSYGFNYLDNYMTQPANPPKQK